MASFRPAPVAGGVDSARAVLHTPAVSHAAYTAVRGQTMALAAPLSPEDCQVQSMPDASPTKWHLAHTTWFFETFVLVPHAAGYREYEPRFRFLFNSYYNAVGAQYPRSARGLLSRPRLEEVLAYRAHVDAAMQRLIEAGSLAPALLAVVELGLHHEQQHQELIVTDIKHALASNPLRPAYRAGPGGATHSVPEPGAQPVPDHAARAAMPLAWNEFDETVTSVGHAGGGFAFDNETPRHRVLVPAHRLGTRLVTNGEYLEFIRAGGYAQPELWLSEGWDVVRAQQWCAPLYWEERDGAWWNATLAGERQVVLEEPVCHVSYYDADAFARWAGARLPTEFEWEQAAEAQAATARPAAAQPPAGNFLEDGVLHPVPAPGSGTAHGQWFGDVWEWTSSAYAPYPGYQPAAGALGEYNGKFMVNQLVLRGGSCATPRSHIRASYRNFFPAATRWQFSGARLARS